MPTGANDSMLQVALFEPEIPPNTGNIARLCAATGAPLHLIGRLGFRIDERSLRRAGLDYWPAVQVHRHATFGDFERFLAGGRRTGQHTTSSPRIVCFSARASRPYTSFHYQDGDVLLFGGEAHGLPDDLLARHADSTVTIPMPTGKVRSLNLATAVGIALYEALRQVALPDTGRNLRPDSGSVVSDHDQ
jgi:tRNA (cytidine/uridine-2'-O-)-methyltransferase